MTDILIYLREAPGLTSIEAQREALRSVVDQAEPDAVFLDQGPRARRKGDNLGLPERNRCTAAITPGATVHVAEIGVIGDSLADAMAVLEAWTARGASLHVVADSLMIAPDDGSALWRAAQRIEQEATLRRTSAARAAQMESARKRRELPSWKRAKAMLEGGQDDYPVIAQQTGISESTLRRAVRNDELPRRNRPQAGDAAPAIAEADAE